MQKKKNRLIYSQDGFQEQQRFVFPTAKCRYSLGDKVLYISGRDLSYSIPKTCANLCRRLALIYPLDLLQVSTIDLPKSMA
jgi:hypothetical protein